MHKKESMQNLWQSHEGVYVDFASVLRNFRQMEACIWIKSNSKRYRAILSGKTDNSWYQPYSTPLPFKYFSISRRHTQHKEYLLRKKGGSSEFCTHPHLSSGATNFISINYFFRVGYDANGQPLMVLLDQIWDHIVSMHRIHIQDRRHWFSL